VLEGRGGENHRNQPRHLTCITTAPAPSPKRMQVPLSLQSTKRERPSAPITRTFLNPPPVNYKEKKSIVFKTQKGGN